MVIVESEVTEKYSTDQPRERERGERERFWSLNSEREKWLTKSICSTCLTNNNKILTKNSK